MSVSPLQNSSKPPPVPDVPTVMFTPEFSPWKASAAAEVRGPTVEEPSIVMSPERSDPAGAVPAAESSSPPQPAATSVPRANAVAAIATAIRRPRAIWWCSSR